MLIVDVQNNKKTRNIYDLVLGNNHLIIVCNEQVANLYHEQKIDPFEYQNQLRCSNCVTSVNSIYKLTLGNIKQFSSLADRLIDTCGGKVQLEI